MICCEGEGCTKKNECRRYQMRKSSDLVSRVLCRCGTYSWFVRTPEDDKK